MLYGITFAVPIYNLCLESYIYLTLFDLKGAYGSYTLHWIGTRTGTGNEEMGLQPICLSPIPCHCPCVVCTVEGILYKLIVAGPSPIPVPGP